LPAPGVGAAGAGGRMLDLHGYGAHILAGTWINVVCGLWALTLSVVLGILAALAKLSSTAWLRGIANVYTTIIRGVPDLLMMMMIFFGGQVLVNQIMLALGSEEYVDVNPFVAGVISIGFIYGAYMAETFRGAILAVPKGQLEAGYAYGMSGMQVFLRILLPQMIRHALPSFGNNWLVLLKTTALLSIVGLEDMVYRARQAGGSVHEPFTFLLTVAMIYLALTTVSIWALRLAEKRYSLGMVR
jgi:arginine/ornithine transport system permease protein